MPKSEAIIPRAPVARIMVSSGAKRVSVKAVDEFSKVLERKAADIAKRAAQLARHAGRKTVTAEDVRMALK
ncbi:histone family protein [Candidatus Woesearchaeota archaeon]|nr:histone family protein [Candidatus Woesearchaeota archaeon]